jgi:hypothetical protein
VIRGLDVVDRPSRAPKIDPRLEAVDRLAIRWASGERPTQALHPLEAIRLLHDGATLGGGPIPTPDDIMKFDECFMASPQRHRALITVWYRSSGSAKQKAAKLGVSRASLYIEWGHTLSYFRGWLRGAGIDI